MTEILERPTTLAVPGLAADEPLAELLSIALGAAGPLAAEEREDAVTAALHHIYTEYPDTVGQVQVLEATEWRGMPALRAADLAPSAVAYLGAGLWLHHSLDIPEEEPARDVLTLIAPCSCRAGYVEFELQGDTDLVTILTVLSREEHTVWHRGGTACTSTRA
ncbi:hypothetical protein ABR738_01280 [Streptomyces sp. Edi4]|uniref:hypothetical protein n=1 Tax=Streptomyces sp. Edi4 TaxID=3162527 RepID=UPI0033062552